MFVCISIIYFIIILTDIILVHVIPCDDHPDISSVQTQGTGKHESSAHHKQNHSAISWTVILMNFMNSDLNSRMIFRLFQRSSNVLVLILTDRCYPKPSAVFNISDHKCEDNHTTNDLQLLQIFQESARKDLSSAWTLQSSWLETYSRTFEHPWDSCF